MDFRRSATARDAGHLYRLPVSANRNTMGCYTTGSPLTKMR